MGVLKPLEAEDRPKVASLAPTTPIELQACGERLQKQIHVLTPAVAIDNKITNLRPKNMFCHLINYVAFSFLFNLLLLEVKEELWIIVSESSREVLEL